MSSGKRRKLLVVSGIILTGVILLALIGPLWAPWFLRPALATYGIEISGYERLGYTRLRLQEVSYARSNVVFLAKSVEIHQPTVWLARYVSRQFSAEDLLVKNWNLEILQKEKKAGAATTSARKILQTTEEKMRRFSPWFATARLETGVIAAQGHEIVIPQARWDEGTISALVSTTNFAHSITVNGKLTVEPKTLSVSIPGVAAEADLRIEAGEAATTEIRGELRWQANTVQASATFDRDSLWPSHATLVAEHFRIPATLLRLQGYKDLEGSLKGQWATNTFALGFQATASPLEVTNLPPVSLSVQASCDTNIVRIDRAHLSAPWLTASLSTNVIFNFSGELLSPEAALHIAVDLSQQSVVAASGRFKGEAFLQRSEGRYPYARFRVNSEGFSGYDLRLNAVDISGELDWPWLTLGSAHIVFADGGVAHATGRYQMIDRIFAPTTVRLNGQVGHEFLPPNLVYTNIALSASVEGPLSSLAHSGTIEVSGLRRNESAPIRIGSEWKGTALDFQNLSFHTEVRRNAFALAGSARVHTNSLDLRLTSGSLRKDAKEILSLQKPTVLRVERNREWAFEVEKLALKGVADLLLSASVQWPWAGSFQISGRNIKSELWEDFFGPDLPQVDLNQLNVQGAWSNGPVQFSASTHARYTYEKTNVVLLRMDAESDPAGINVREFELLAEVGPVLSGQGRLPLRIVPAEKTNMIQFDRTNAIDFRAATVPNTQLWDEIARLTGVRLRKPNVQMEVTGSLQDPKGHIRFEAESAAWTRKGHFTLPPLTEIKADLNLLEQKVQLTYFAGLLEGQPISLQAELPIDNRAEQDWKKFFDWNNAKGRVLIEKAKFAPFVKYAPDILAPQGTLEAEIAFGRGLQLSGHLTIQDAATRPLPNSGPLQDVYARLRFVQRAIEFEKVQALLGGQPVNFLGRIDFATNAPGGLPLINLFLRGENIPLARRTDLILRSDLNLSLSNLTNPIPMISGDVRLRDSFYLGDLRPLIPGRVVSPKRRPPYFAFEQPPFANWTMNIQVTGQNFLQARSPLFRGSMSSNLRLTGPLKEPVALGEVRTETGTVIFPFANFRVVQGYVTLSSDDPYRPQVLLNGTSRAFGYDLTMNLTGPADRPVIEFSSTPPLTSEQIILMVTAGEVPRRGFGFSQEQRAQRLALFVGKNLLSRFSENAGAERLSITTGEDISEQGRETYALEYRINDKWSIVGEYDRFGALNVGMKWRVYSR